LPLMPAELLSNPTRPVLSLMVAEPHSITVSSLSDGALKTVKSTSLSRTNGVKVGVTPVTSRLVPILQTHAVSSLTLPTLPYNEILEI